MRLAIIGSGISGLVCAYHLSRRFEVHVFESQPHAGGHTHTVDVEVPSGHYAVDTGFIVFNDRTYPRFIRLLHQLGIASQPSNMSFSVKVEKSGLEYNGTDIPRLFSQRSNLFKPSFYHMIYDILRFNREAPRILQDPTFPPLTTLDQYLNNHHYSPEFREHYIIPMGAAIWSAGVHQMRDFPVLFFIRFFKNHGMLSISDRPLWRVIKNGSRSYIPKLTEPFRNRLHLSSPVQTVRRTEKGVWVTTEKNGRREETLFDHVIMASHADQSLAILIDATKSERDILTCFPYQENATTLHTDTSILPKRPQAWASWNYWVPREEKDKVAVTYNMNILQSLVTDETFLVSLNMDSKIDPSKIIRKITYHHPVFDSRSAAAQSRWAEISGRQRTHFCGAYWGFGFHEDGVKSGERVCESLGVTPWS